MHPQHATLLDIMSVHAELPSRLLPRAPRQQASISLLLPWRSAPTMAWRMRLATFSQGPQLPRKNASTGRSLGRGVVVFVTPAMTSARCSVPE